MPSAKKKKTPSKKPKSSVKAVDDNNNDNGNNNNNNEAGDKHDTTSKTTEAVPQTSTITPTTNRKTRSNSTASATSQKSNSSQTNLDLNLNLTPTTTTTTTTTTTSQKSSRRGRRRRKLSRDASVDTSTSTHTNEKNDNDNDEQDNNDKDDTENHDGDAVMEDADPQTKTNKKQHKKVKQPPQMDVAVHRLRHLEFMPKPIACLCATPAITARNDMPSSSPPSSPQEQDESLLSCFVALSRENGSVELKAANEKFRTVAEIAGYKQKVVNCMTWTCGIKTTTTTTRTVSSMNSVTDNDNDDDDKMDEPLSKHKSAAAATTTTSHQPTLIGGSRDGTLFIVDFTRGILTGMTASGGGGVFALTSLCQHQAGRCCCATNINNEKAKATPKACACAQLVAAGCEDGSTRIFKVIPGKRRLELVSILPSASGGSVLSVAWRRNNNNKGTVLFASLSDGTIRRYDSEDTLAGTTSSSNDASDTTNPQKSRSYDTSSGGSWKSRLRMTVESLGRNTPTRVWALQALSDGTLVSCDSLGHVQFWDGDTGTLSQSFDQNESKADVLQMAVSLDECKVFATGVDSRVSCIQRPTEQAAQAANDKERKWILSQVQRPHTHDVKAMTICLQYLHEESSGDTKTSSREVLCTGGIDTKLCTYFVESFKKSRPRTLYPWPAFSPVAQAKDARVIIIRREGQIDLYKLAEPASHHKSVSHARAVSEQETHVGTIELDSPCNLVCATISDNGRFLAACDALSLYVFQLAYVPESKGTAMIPTKLSADIKQIKGSIVHLKFGSNDNLFAATSDGSLHIIDTPLDEDNDDDDDDSNTCTIAMSMKQKKSSKALFPVHSLDFSGDKTYFAALQGGFGCSSVRIFASEEDGKAYRAWWSLPELEWPATSVKFLDNGDLVVLCSNFSFYVFDVKKRQLAPWSQESGVPVSKNLPHELTSRHDYPIRIANNPASPAKILLGSFGAFALIDLEKKIPQSCKFVPENHVRRWKKRRRSLSGGDNAKAVANPDDVESVICLRYNSILHMDFIADNEMVVVEQPWLSVISSFPAALERKIYGS